VLTIWDESPAFGGPIRENRLWFFAAQRYWGNSNSVANIYWNATQHTPFYTPDFSRPSNQYEWYESNALNLTWQISPRNTLGIFADVQRACTCRRQGDTAPEAIAAWRFWPQGLYQVSWSSPVTSKLLVQAGASYTISHWPAVPQPGVLPTDIYSTNLSTGFSWGSAIYAPTTGISDRGDSRLAVSYITGSHHLKVGVTAENGIHVRDNAVNQNVRYYFVQNGNTLTPSSLDEWATPYTTHEELKVNLGLFAQDQWTLRRVTLTYGLRFEYVNGHIPAQDVAPTEFVPFARHYAALDGVPSWKDFSPRMGAAFDVFGNGRTAVKGSLGRYVAALPGAATIPGQYNPLATSVNVVNRSWNDADGNYVPNCDLMNPAQNGECGPISNANFGHDNPNATQYAGDVLHGWFVRPYTWDFAAEIQHQVRPGLFVNGGYYRNWAGNFTVFDNTLVTPRDYDPYCLTAPTDPQLPGGGGYPICGLYDITPAKFNQSVLLVDQASYYGKQTSVNDFFAVGINLRFSGGRRISGGIDLGRSVNDSCFVIDSPNQADPDAPPYCRIVTGWIANLQVKLNASYPLPFRGGFTVSGNYQNVAGPNITATYFAPNAAVVSSLGRNLAACGTTTGDCTATVAIPLIRPQTLFDARRQQVDLRLSKSVTVSPKVRLQLNADAYNVLNANMAQTIVTTYGPSWRQPLTILDGRLFEFGGTVSF
jgi:hypothetical protein